jgi:hypothetical protein
MTFKGKLDKLASDRATNATDTDNLRLATSAKAASDSDVAADVLDVASSVKSARGGFVVDPTVVPPVLYQSTDGMTFTATPISSVTEDVPDPAVVSDPPQS